MKILHILAQLPAHTGSGIFFKNLIRELESIGHENSALFAVQDGGEYDFLPACEQYPVCFRTPSLPFCVAGMSDIMPYPNTVYSQMDENMIGLWESSFREAICRARDEFMPEAVILHHLWMLTSMAAEVFDCAAKIGICHNTDLRQAEMNPDLKKRYVTNIGRLDIIFALGEAQIPQIERIYGFDPKRIVTLSAGFDTALFYPEKEKREKAGVDIVYASKIDRAKGVYSLLRAIEPVFAAYEEARLHIVGTPDAENAAELERLVRGRENIVLSGALPQADLAELFRRTDIYVMPSFFEGVPLTAIESLACGMRVVATDVGGLKGQLGEYISNCGAVEFISLPPMRTLDIPQEAGLSAFEAELTEKLMLQAERVKRGEPFPSEVFDLLGRFSWSSIAEVVERYAAEIRGGSYNDN